MSGLAGDSYGRVQCSSERHSSTNNHLVSEGLWQCGKCGTHTGFSELRGELWLELLPLFTLQT